MAGDVLTPAEAPGLADLDDYRRVPCRIVGCPQTIPWTPGYWIDGTCWRHHHLVVPSLPGGRR